MLEVKGSLDSPLHAVHYTSKSSQLIILSLFQYKMSEILQFWCKLNTSRILNPVRFAFCVIIIVIPSMICFPSFLTISYCFPSCFRMFPLVFLRFPWVFLLFPLSVSTVSYFRFHASFGYILCFRNKDRGKEIIKHNKHANEFPHSLINPRILASKHKLKIKHGVDTIVFKGIF